MKSIDKIDAAGTRTNLKIKLMVELEPSSIMAKKWPSVIRTSNKSQGKENNNLSTFGIYIHFNE